MKFAALFLSVVGILLSLVAVQAAPSPVYPVEVTGLTVRDAGMVAKDIDYGSLSSYFTRRGGCCSKPSSSPSTPADLTRPPVNPGSTAPYDTGNPKPETPTGEWKPKTDGKMDDYFGNWPLYPDGQGAAASGS